MGFPLGHEDGLPDAPGLGVFVRTVGVVRIVNRPVPFHRTPCVYFPSPHSSRSGAWARSGAPLRAQTTWCAGRRRHRDGSTPAVPWDRHRERGDPSPGQRRLFFRPSSTSWVVAARRRGRVFNDTLTAGAEQMSIRAEATEDREIGGPNKSGNLARPQVEHPLSEALVQ